MHYIYIYIDRPTYLRVLPQHISDLASYNEETLRCLEKGGFAANITGTQDKDLTSLALDEAHEMMINKDVKAGLTRTTESAIGKHAKEIKR